VKRFTFRLGRLLELREAAERHQAAEMGRAAGAEAEQRKRVDASAAHLQSVRDQASATEAPTAAGLFGSYRLAVDAADIQVEADARALLRATEDRQREADRFTKARQERQVLERIRARRLTAWEIDAARAEQETNDEVASRRGAGRVEL
jgi:flagellar export protein FliJ